MVRSGKTAVLLDAGISKKQLCTSLKNERVAAEALTGICITHIHYDHICGLSNFLEQYPTSVYVTSSVADALAAEEPKVSPWIHVIPRETPFTLGNMTVTAFPVPHDAPGGNTGFQFQADGSKLTCATDSGCVTQTMLQYFLGSDAALVEANHDSKMLAEGPYPQPLKNRILSDLGHLSNSECTWFSSVLASHGTSLILLGHISPHNNRPELAYSTVKRGLEGTHAVLHVAPARGKLAVEIPRCSA